jgi:hypothetical protein
MDKLINKLRSPVLKVGLIALLSLALKKWFNLEAETQFLDEIIELGFILIGIIAGFNNPDNSEEF